MRRKTGIGCVLQFVLAAVVVMGAAQYIVLLLHLQAAQKDFENWARIYQGGGEKAYREGVVEALEMEGFEVDAKDISILDDGSSVVKFRLAVSRERDVLWVPVRKEAVLTAEIPYDPDL